MVDVTSPHPHGSMATAQARIFLERESSADSDPVQSFSILSDVMQEANRQYHSTKGCDPMFLTKLLVR